MAGSTLTGILSEGLGKVKFLIVAIDYFTKLIEAKPVATITDNQVKKFIWDNIVYIFGLPGEIVSDNGKKFRDNPNQRLVSRKPLSPIVCLPCETPHKQKGLLESKSITVVWRGRNQSSDWDAERSKD
ncbi:reverse transcriptase domain-containing protein [Tanacetum coccineum]|uniref:Reverse transcriptase domain-containing protein n=1 Tax=Tanacetum coccineum TaxID=301880 RepID=A0ABQ5IM15_9ASTR